MCAVWTDALQMVVMSFLSVQPERVDGLQAVWEASETQLTHWILLNPNDVMLGTVAKNRRDDLFRLAFLASY